MHVKLYILNFQIYVGIKNKIIKDTVMQIHVSYYQNHNGRSFWKIKINVKFK